MKNDPSEKGSAAERQRRRAADFNRMRKALRGMACRMFGLDRRWADNLESPSHVRRIQQDGHDADTTDRK